MSDPIASQPVPPPNKPITVQLARALAEAADGLPNHGPTTYLVAPYHPVTDEFAGGYQVWGPFRNWKAVPDDLKCRVEEGECGFFGPYHTIPKPARGLPIVRVDLHISGGMVLTIDGDVPDALFFRQAAVEKFAAPYYERLFGPVFAQRALHQFQNTNVQVMAHYPWSEYSDGTRVPNVPVLLHPDSSQVALDPSGQHERREPSSTEI